MSQITPEVDEKSPIIQSKIRNDSRLRATIVTFEIISIGVIINMYFLWALKWNTAMHENILAALSATSYYAAGQTIGGLFWAVVYFVFLFMSVAWRSSTVNMRTFAMITAANVSYHLVRWPIFFIMLNKSVSSSSDGTPPEVSVDMAVMAFWLDPVIFATGAAAVLLIGGIGKLIEAICC